MNDLYKKYFKKPHQKRGEKAVDDILESFNNLISDSDFEGVTTRDLIKRSGYSNGTLYRYFKKIDHIFLNRFIDKVNQGNSESIYFLENFSPHKDFHQFAEEFISLGFQHWKSPVKPTIIRIMLRYFLRNSENPELLNCLQDPVIPYILQTQKRDLTGTFRQMTEDEIRLCIRAVQAAIRSPFIENHSNAGSSEHKAVAIKIAVAIFGQESLNSSREYATP